MLFDDGIITVGCDKIYLDSLYSGHYEQDEEDYDDNIYKKPIHVGRKFIIDRPEIINDMLSIFIETKE